MTTRMIVRATLVALALSSAGAASFAAVSLPSKANSHAVSATANVTTGSTNVVANANEIQATEIGRAHV